MIEIKRNIADDLEALADELCTTRNKSLSEKKKKQLTDEITLLEYAAKIQRKYQLLVDNGVNETLAAAIAAGKQ